MATMVSVQQSNSTFNNETQPEAHMLGFQNRVQIILYLTLKNKEHPSVATSTADAIDAKRLLRLCLSISPPSTLSLQPATFPNSTASQV